jgi:hypothetical protein
MTLRFFQVEKTDIGIHGNGCGGPTPAFSKSADNLQRMRDATTTSQITL